MKIYDCFIFSSELEILDLRLSFLNDTVDYFVIVESSQTLTGLSKPLYYKDNEKKYEKYKNKVIYLECPVRPELGAWDYEFFQRNYIKQGLLNCVEEDIVLISDVDEIVNLKAILNYPSLTFPSLISLPIYYYFLNLRSDYAMPQNLIAKYSFIKDFSIGLRLPFFPDNIKNCISAKHLNVGWHFSFLFGFDIDRYVEKIKSFSHQEYNTVYYLNTQRIKRCIENGVDIFERGSLPLKFDSANDILLPIRKHIEETGLDKYLYCPPNHISISDKLFILRKKIIPKYKRSFFSLYHKYIFLKIYSIVKGKKIKT